MGSNLVCKIQEQLKTDDKTQRSITTRKIFDDETKGGKELLLWRNKMLMKAGFIVKYFLHPSGVVISCVHRLSLIVLVGFTNQLRPHFSKNDCLPPSDLMMKPVN